MNIAQSIKKALATFSAFALMLTSMPVAFAQTFNDVATDAWYFDYVEQLVDEGVFDVSDNFNPNNPLNRAELTKIAVTAVDGLVDFEPPATPTFDDVATDAWFYDYVEAAVQLGIVSGYTDAAGNLTGLFGPGDTVNRAAATKILVNAFAVPTTLSPASPFGDVPTSAWFHDYVLTAYNQSVLDGYANGNFGPADPVTRAQISKLVVNSQDPVPRFDDDEPVDEDDDDDAPVSGEGALEVSLNDDTAPSSTVPTSAASVELLSIDYTAADDDVNLTGLTVTRGGVGNAVDWESLYVYDGTNRLTTGRSINSDTNQATFNFDLDVDAGTTRTLRVVGDVEAAATATANNQHYFYLASASAVNSNAQSVAGDFPVTGNTFTIGSVATTTVTISAGSLPAQPTVGANDEELAAFRLAAGADNDLALHQISLTQNGALSSTKMVNLKLLANTDVVATAEGLDGDILTFVLDTPYIIDEGQTRSFFVRGDLTGGRPDDDTVQLYLDEKTDLIAIDQQYGFGAGVTNNYGTAQSTAIALQGGGVTINDNGPAATQVAQNDENVALFDFSITATRDLTVKEADLAIRVGSAGDFTDILSTDGSSTTIAGAGNLSTGFDTAADICEDTANSCAGDVMSVVSGGTTYYCMITGDATGGGDTTAGTNTLTSCPSIALAGGETVTFGYDPYQYIENVRIFDVDSGQTLQGPVTRWNATTTLSGDGSLAEADASYSKTMTEDYDLKAGETRHLRVEVDLNQNMPIGLEIDSTLTFGAADIKDFEANKDVPVSDIVGDTQTSNRMTVEANSLTVAETANVISQEYVKSSQGVDAYEVSMTAGDAGAITVKKINLRVYADSANNGFAAGGDIEGKNAVSAVYLYEGDTLIAGPIAPELVGTSFVADNAGSYSKVLFDDLNLVIEKGGTRTFRAKVDLLDAASGNFVALDIDPDDDIISEDEEANDITETPATSLNLAATPDSLITVIASGTLTADSTSGSISQEVWAGGTDDILVSKYNFTAEKEAFTVNKLTIVDDDNGDADFGDPVATSNTLDIIKLQYPDVNGNTVTKTASLTAGTHTFSSLGMYVPKDGTATLEVWADAKAITTGTFTLSGKKFRIGMRDVTNTSSTFEAVGVDSSTQITSPTIQNSANVVQHVLRKAKPVFTGVNQATTQMGTTNVELYKFQVTADGGNVVLARMIFDINTAGLQTAATDDVYNFNFEVNGSEVNGVNIFALGSTGCGAVATVNVEDAASGSGLQDACTTAAGVDNVLYKVIVSFDNAEEVIANQTNTYTLKASIAGATNDDTIDTNLATSDEGNELSGILAPDSSGNGNSGTLADDNTDNVALFGDADTQCSTTDNDTDALANVVGTNCDIIWSDKSGGNDAGDDDANATVSGVHTYPTVASGVVTNESGTVDFTNGYLLNVDTLAGYSYKK